MKRVVSIIFAIFLITGCIPKATHQINTYDLSVNIDTTSTKRVNKVLKVKYPMALGAINSSRIFYKKDGITSYYLYSRWSDSLSRLIYKDILTALQNSKKYKDVIGYSSSARADLSLEVEIVDFYHIVENSNTSYALITINVRYLDEKTQKIVKSKVFRYKKYLDNANAKSFVKAAKEALREFLIELI